MALVYSCPAFAQCLCGHIRFAIQDSLPYTYRFYEIGKTDTLTVEFLSLSDQLHKGQEVLHSHESYGVYDKDRDTIVTKLHDNRKYLYNSIDNLGDFAIEVTGKKKKQKMTLFFTKRSYDITYNILTDFRPGTYRIDLSEMWHRFYDQYDTGTIIYRDTELKAIKSNFPENKYRDWISIQDIRKFKTN